MKFNRFDMDWSNVLIVSVFIAYLSYQVTHTGTARAQSIIPYMFMLPVAIWTISVSCYLFFLKMEITKIDNGFVLKKKFIISKEYNFTSQAVVELVTTCSPGYRSNRFLDVQEGDKKLEFGNQLSSKALKKAFNYLNSNYR